MTDDKSSALPRLIVPDDEERGSAETRLLAPGEMLYAGKQRVPWFVAVHGTRSAGRMFRIRSGTTIGRAIGSDILLDEEGVSRRHAKLRVLSTGQVLIEDLGSSNGIFFGEERIERRVLSDGERIRVGDVVLALLLLDAPEEAGAALEAIDPDTRLPNRRSILGNLADTLDYAARYNAPMAFCVLLVDQLRDVHDVHGSSVASTVIAQLAMTARNVIQDEEACVGRFSEDEIAIVLPDANLTHGARCAEWIRRAVEATPLEVASKKISVTVTGGVATNGPGESPNAANIVEQARRNLCRAVLGGRNRIEPLAHLSSS